MNNTTVFPSYTQHKFSFMKLCLWLGCGESFLSLNCLLCWTLSPVMIFLGNGSFLCHERRLVVMDWRFSLFFSLRVWGTQTPSFLNFPIVFKWRQIVSWNVLKSSAYSRVFMHGLHPTNPLKAYWSRSDEHHGLGIYLNDVTPEWNFKKQSWIWWSVMTPWP